MLPSTKIPPKPRSEQLRPELVRLPKLHPWRRLVRRLLNALMRLLVFVFTQTEVRGIENVPRDRAALFVTNHLGDADFIVGLAITPVPVDVIAKIELFDLPILGKLLDAYGVIWVHRGQPDRRAIRAALRGLAEGRIVAIAPEGRESLTGGLEEATSGAAYLALRAKVPLLPVTFTGTENATVYGNMKRLRRTKITVTIGKLFYLEEAANRKDALQRGTELIMKTLAAQLPAEYQGMYRSGT